MPDTILVTGSNGTIGRYLIPLLEEQGFLVKTWDRNKIAIDNYAMMEDYVHESSVKALIHLAAITSFDPIIRQNSWNVNVHWPSELAWICQTLNVKFVFSSSSMVFSSDGPYYLTSAPDAAEGYGYEKIIAEEKVMQQNTKAVILRLGWQIAETGNNSMIAALDIEQKQNGLIRASRNWYPSCSFVEDTCRVIMDAMHFSPGIYMVNANHSSSFCDIVLCLKDKMQKDWNVIPTDDFKADHRMIDERIALPEILSF